MQSPVALQGASPDKNPRELSQHRRDHNGKIYLGRSCRHSNVEALCSTDPIGSHGRTRSPAELRAAPFTLIRGRTTVSFAPIAWRHALPGAEGATKRVWIFETKQVRGLIQLAGASKMRLGGFLGTSPLCPGCPERRRMRGTSGLTSVPRGTLATFEPTKSLPGSGPPAHTSNNR
jgi:hypothetical protein